MTASISQYKSLQHIPLMGRAVLILGQPDSGKSMMTYDLVSRLQTNPAGPAFAKVLILSPTARDQDYWSGFPDRDVHTEPETYASIMEQVLEHQRSVEKSMRLPVLLIIDDVIGQLDGAEGKNFKKVLKSLVTSGRHNDVAVIIISQSFKDGFVSNPIVRSGCSCIVSAIINSDHRDALEKSLGLGKEARKVTTEAWSEPYRFICYDQSTGCKTGRHSFVKIDERSVIKGFGIRYRQ